jgi:hypothetical protein
LTLEVGVVILRSTRSSIIRHPANHQRHRESIRCLNIART